MSEEVIKLISWNINGMKAIRKKGFLDALEKLDADIVAVQETKLHPATMTGEIESVTGYTSYWSHSIRKKGYSGVGVYTRLSPVNVSYGIGINRYDDEGRILELEFEDFIFFNIYFPNGKMSEERLQYKLDFYRDFFQHADRCAASGKHLVIAGDYNTAHNEIDLKNPRANEKYSGFLRIERDWLDKITREGYVDTFRYVYPDTVKYSWWTYRFNARTKNVGWRIDYFFVTESIIRKNKLKDAFIENDIFGSDHCPVGIILRV
ncbi:MAG: exodeoxyribonuclease III [Desulfobacterales bacterium]